MQWNDRAIITSCKKYGEKSAIITLFAENHGVFKGVVNNYHSKKHRSIYIAGNIVEATWKARLSDHLGLLSCELISSLAGFCLNNRSNFIKLSAVISLVELLLPERESNKNIYLYLDELLTFIKQDSPNFLEKYVIFELLLLKELGFGLEFSSCVVTGGNDNLKYISPKSGHAVSAEAGEDYKDRLIPLPEFLHKDIPASNFEIEQALHLAGYFLEKKLLRPFNKKLPSARMMMQKTEAFS